MHQRQTTAIGVDILAPPRVNSNRHTVGRQTAGLETPRCDWLAYPVTVSGHLNAALGDALVADAAASRAQHLRSEPMSGMFVTREGGRDNHRQCCPLTLLRCLGSPVADPRRSLRMLPKEAPATD